MKKNYTILYHDHKKLQQKYVGLLEEENENEKDEDLEIENTSANVTLIKKLKE